MEFFTEKILRFYSKNSRDFFWRREPCTPFQILIVELLLQKTQAVTIDARMSLFIDKYMNPGDVLNEHREEIYNQIKILGLGKQRLGALYEISEYISENFCGEVPRNQDKLLKIPHIGRYIANATLCFAYNQRIEVIDSNVKRVLGRYFGIEVTDRKADREKLEETAKSLLPKRSYKKYNWGLLDFGALVCSPKPKCEICPLRIKCKYYNQQISEVL